MPQTQGPMSSQKREDTDKAGEGPAKRGTATRQPQTGTSGLLRAEQRAGRRFPRAPEGGQPAHACLQDASLQD